MFQRKIYEIFKDMSNVFSIADDILVVGYKADGNYHDDTVCRVLQRCRQVNLKLNKDKESFQLYISTILWGHYIAAWSKTRPTRDQGLNGNSHPKEEAQAFLGIINYSGKFSPSTTGICK